MASLDDLFSAAKNLVTAVQNLTQLYLTVQGNKASLSLAAATTTTITTGQGRLAAISVTTAGSTAGSVYDSNQAAPAANSLLAAIPNTVGVHIMSIPYISGLTVTTGTGQVATVVYS